MTIDLPQAVGFVLTAFSIVAILVPYIYQQNPENSISDERRDIRALYVIQNKDSTSTSTDEIWAYNRLHDFQKIDNLYKEINQTRENKSESDLNVTKTVKEEIKLAAAVANFNNNNDSKSKEIFDSLKQDKSYDYLFNQTRENKSERDFLYKVLYTERLFNNTWYVKCLDDILQKQQYENDVCKDVKTNPDLYKQQHENVVCKTNEIKPCVYTQKELLDIRKNITDLVENGYDTNFYRKDIIVNSLHESIKKFITDFHTFIIASFIT